MAKVEVVKSENAGTPNYIWVGIIVICFIVGIVIAIFNSEDGINLGSKKCDTYECSWAEQCALEDIPELGYVWSTVKSNELKCEANSITDDEIILVKCTTTHDEIIDYFGSSTIWYGYLSSADGSSYFRWADKDSSVVLNKLRQ